MSHYVGELVLITNETKIDRVFADPVTVKISITKDTKSGTSVLIATDMTKTSTGHYLYNWDSSGQEAGTFWAKIEGVKTAPGNREYVKIILI